MGLSVSTDDVGVLLKHPLLSILVVGITISVHATMYVVLRATTQWPRRISLLSSVPGAQSFAIAIAEKHKSEPGLVASTASARFLLVLAVVPVLFFAFHGKLSEAGPSTSSGLSIGPSFAWLLLPLALGALARFIGVAGGEFIGAFIGAAFLSHQSLFSSQLPPFVVWAALLALGCSIGLRLSSATRTGLQQSVFGGVVTAGAASLVVVPAAYLLERSIGLPMSLGILALAPGGVEAMSAIALSTAPNAALVPLLQTIRLAIVLLYLPAAARILGDTNDPKTR